MPRPPLCTGDRGRQPDIQLADILFAGIQVTDIQVAGRSVFGMFQPETLSTGAAPFRSDECQVTEMVWDSPGHRVMSLPFHSDDWSSLSPGSSRPVKVPRRMSARRKKATVRAF